MYTVIVTLDVHPDKIDEFIDAIAVNSKASLENEPGCLRFDVHRSTERDNRFYLYEVYRDEEAFTLEHRAAPHYAVWRAASAQFVENGSHTNQFGEPLFPDRIPEAVALAS